jgi:hypothetical protein
VSYFNAAWSGRTHASMHLSLGCLAVLGLQHMGQEWSDSLAVWSYGRDASLGALAPYACIALSGVSAIAFALGLRWRLAGATLCASMAAAYVLAPVTYHNNLYLLWLLVLLTVTTAPVAYVPRALLREATTLPDHIALFPRLVQWQVAIVYVGSVFVKATHPMWHGTGGVIRWLAGVRVPEINQGLVNPILRPVLMHRGIASALDVAVMVAEMIIPLMLFSTRLRRTGFACGVVLHGFMQAWLYPQLFTFLMLWGYYAFVPSGDRAWRVTYVPASAFDAALARVYPKLDWMGRTTWAPGPSLTLTDAQGTVRGGVTALRWLMVLTPVTLLAFATLSLAAPGTRQMFTVPRDAIENVVLLAWASLWLPGAWERTLGWVRSQPSRSQE